MSDLVWGAEALADIGDKRAIPALQKMLDNAANDPRWWDRPGLTEWIKKGHKFPDDFQQYPRIKKCLERLRRGK